ncbi:MAG: hypothetical protein KJ792_09255 [Actinobacteria bacterium]|nr:hypothetical protein [Actinomycetota bacterium]MCG2801637.1 hypothetical protein [Cellulomonas sp.]
MTETIVVLTEDALADADVAHLLELHPQDEVDYRVLVPADTDQPLLATVLDELGLGDLRDALRRAVGREPDAGHARATATERLERTLHELAAAGRTATGQVTLDDPLPALRAAVADGGVREIVVVTYPHLVEDTLHTDWASRAREELKVPVLHLYSGTSELG